MSQVSAQSDLGMNLGKTLLVGLRSYCGLHLSETTDKPRQNWAAIRIKPELILPVTRLLRLGENQTGSASVLPIVQSGHDQGVTRVRCDQWVPGWIICQT